MGSLVSDAPSDIELNIIHDGYAMLGRIAGRYAAAKHIADKALYDAAHGELKWAGLCNCDEAAADDTLDEAVNLPADHPLAQAFAAALSALPGSEPEPDDLDRASTKLPAEAENRCADCGDVIHLTDGTWRHLPGLRSPHEATPSNLTKPEGAHQQ